MSVVTYLAEQVQRVRNFLNAAGYYQTFAKYLDLMTNAKNVTKDTENITVTCTPLEVRTLYEFTFGDAAETDCTSFTVGKMRTINEAQSQTPEGDYTDYVYTQPSLITDKESVTKDQFAQRIVAQLDLVTGTGAEYARDRIKESILVDLLKNDVLFGGIGDGHIITTIDGADTLHTRYFTFYRPDATAWLVVDGKVTEIWE